MNITIGMDKTAAGLLLNISLLYSHEHAVRVSKPSPELFYLLLIPFAKKKNEAHMYIYIYIYIRTYSRTG